MKVKDESEKVGVKLNIQKMKIMASGSITSWQIDGETVEALANYFLGLKNHCGWLQSPSAVIFEPQKSLRMVIEAMKLKDAYSLERKL